MNAPSVQQVKDYAAKLASNAKLPSIDQKALHPYRAPDGTPLYWRIRLKCDGTGEKWIRPFFWNGTAFENTEPPAPPEGKPLYGLDHLTASPDAQVIVTEGESCSDALNKAFEKWQKTGVIAITSGGAQSAGAADWGPLANRRVIVWPDNDESGGKYALDVVEALHGVSASIVVMDISTLNMPPKGDAVDWLSTGGNLDGLMTLIDATRTQPQNLTNPEIETEQPERSDEEAIQWLVSLKPFEYDRVRNEQAKALGVRSTTLDAMVKAAQNEGGEAGRLPFNEVEPYPHPIDPAQLLDEVTDTIKRFIVLDTEQAHAAALWVALTWFIDSVEVAPLAIITAPEMACGKSQLHDLLAKIVMRPLSTNNMKAATLFRISEKWHPSLMLDEVDLMLKSDDEIINLVNAGHHRGASQVWRLVGDNHEPKSFDVWGAKCFAGIALEKIFPASTMSRAIVIKLRRKMAHESVGRLRHADEDAFVVVAEKLARFGADYSQQVRQARPSLPDALSDRDQDNWEPLLAIASCAGAVWLDRAIAAALKLSGAGEHPMSIGNELLQDIRHVFESKRVDRISTADLIEALCADEELSWNTHNRGKPLSPRQLGSRLKEYGVNSKQMRFSSYDNPIRGFEREQFNDAFLRYLPDPQNLPLHVTKSLQANNDGGLNVTDRKSCNVTENLPVTPEAPYSLGCNAVTDKTPFSGGCENAHSNVSHLRI